ncbi:MAG TPA: acyl-CoA dehydrogenase family protein [Streptosporangiaceae bacterium]|jgi:alkylation response protein AidB-like acyl-CoA dehydrogenase
MTDVVASGTQSGGTGGRGFLDAVRARRATFEAAARRAEEERTLPADVVEVLRDERLFWLKTPRELGGSELDPLEFCDVLEEIAYCDASAAWTTMVGNGTTGTLAGWLADDGVREIFPAGGRLPICAGQFVARGTAVPVDDGYLVTGRWSFCSGINHADWLVGGCRVPGSAANETGDKEILAVVPKDAATLHDTWYVSGLQGTGSGDFSLTEVFVPAGRTLDWLGAPPQRGGDLFKLPTVLFVSNELSPVAVGVARRAIDDMYALASATARRVGGVSLRDRAAFQKDMSRAECRIRAASLLYRDTVKEAWTTAGAGAEPDPGFIPRQLARHTLVVEECTDVVVKIIRYGGGRVLALDHPMQRHLRNLTAAMQHFYISDENYELAGKARLAEFD